MITIRSLKKKTRVRSIVDFPKPKLLFLPLDNPIGKASVPLVKPGDYVKKYQLIASGDGRFSVNQHAPVSGIVKEISEKQIQPGIKIKCILIENDFKEITETLHPVDTDRLKPQELVEAIFQAGIVGQGGAQFPTHVKLDIGESKLTTIIINGAECEPYLSADYRLMHQESDKILRAAALVAKTLGAANVIVGIERSNKDLINVLKQNWKEDTVNFSVRLLKDGYPEGGELQLIRSLTGKTLPKGTIPISKGLLVSNAGTFRSIYDALFLGIPLTERIITISGSRPFEGMGNYRVPIGTPISELLAYIGKNTGGNKFIPVLGGPMMGKIAYNIESFIQKGSGALLLLSRQPSATREHCIGCGYCVDDCPMHLSPIEFARATQLDKQSASDRLKTLHIKDCIECGLCQYVCPSSIPLMKYINQGKSILANG